MILFKEWMIYMNNKKIDTKEERTKIHEDALLKKIHRDHMRQALDEARSDNTGRSRDQFEQELLEKLINNMGHSPDLSAQKSEMLMITSAVELSGDEKEAIVRKFIEKTGKRLRQITTVVDPSLITGIRLQSESFYYEVTGQKILRDLRKHLDHTWHY